MTTHDTPEATHRVEWRDEIRPWDEHVAAWAGSRVPVAGDYIDLPGNGCRKVTAVMWDLDGTCVIRVEFHPIPEPLP